jgi:hypothetical protein
MRCIRFAVLALSGLAAAPVAAASLITNGTFDAPDISGVFVTVNAAGAISGWTLDDDGTAFGPATTGILGIDIVQDRTAGGWQTLGGTANADGVGQNLDIDGLSKLSQSFATMPGATYRLSFEYSHNPLAFSRSRSADVTVMGVGSLLSETVTHALANDFDDMKWLTYSKEFVADAAMATLMFAGKESGNATERAQGFALDNVAVEFIRGPATVVPLPGTLPLAVGAFAAFGLLRRRR